MKHLCRKDSRSNLCLVASSCFALAVIVFLSLNVSTVRDEDLSAPPGWWCSSEPGLISIPDPIHNRGLRERGPNEEMKHHGKVAIQSSKERRGTAVEALFTAVFIAAYFFHVTDIEEQNSKASVRPQHIKLSRPPRILGNSYNNCYCEITKESD